MELTTMLIVRIIVCAFVSLILWLMGRGNWAAGSSSKRSALFIVGVIAWGGVVGVPLYTQWQEQQRGIAYEEKLRAYEEQVKANIKQASEDLSTNLGGRELKGPMALYPFHEEDREGSRLGHYLSERMIAPLMMALKGRCTFVERRRLEDALQELKFQDSDLTDESKNYELGQMIGARYILTGTITVRRSDRFELFLRILDAVTGELVSAVNAMFPYSPELRDALATEEIR